MKLKNNIIHCYVDGSAIPNPGPCAAACVIFLNGFEKEYSEYLGEGTNNIGELYSIKLALSKIKIKTIPVHVYSDSQYSIGVLTNWKAKANIELINEIKRLMSEFKSVKFIKVKGHSGNPLNERVDKLVKECCQNGIENEHNNKN